MWHYLKPLRGLLKILCNPIAGDIKLRDIVLGKRVTLHRRSLPPVPGRRAILGNALTLVVHRAEVEL